MASTSDAATAPSLTASGFTPAATRTDVGPDARRWLMPLLALLAYAVLLLLTRTLDQGDTNVYADSLVGGLRGTEGTMWEFGHPLWRPLAYALFSLVHSDAARSTDGMLFSQAFRVLTTMSMLGGAIAVLAFQSWLRRLGVPRGVAFGTTVAFISASAFLGYAQTGSSYITALAMILVGLRALAAEDSSSDRRTIVIASLAFACAVLLWVPMVFAVPASAASMLILRGDSPRRRRVMVSVWLLSGLIAIAAYVPIAVLAGIRSAADLRKWIADSSHDIQNIGGLPRAIVGFGRSLLDMARLGLVTKRHLLGDPFNPTTLGDIARAGLARLVLLYALLGVMVVALARRAPTRRALWLLVATAIFVVGFGIAWQGGDLERHLALFPAVFLAVALSLTLLDGRARAAAATAVPLMFVALNVPAISRMRSNEACVSLTARLESVPRQGMPTMIFTPHELDEMVTYRNRCPSAALLTSPTPPLLFGLVMAHNAKAPAWRDTLAARSERAWATGGHVWISRRAFVSKPLRSWKWAEGDDPRLHWKDFPTFFRQVDVGSPVGGEDGFVEILPTPKTREVLARSRTAPPS